MNPQDVTGAHNEKQIKGSTPIPNAEFKLNASEFEFLKRLSKDIEYFAAPFNAFVSAIQMLEQKFIADGNLVYFYDEDLDFHKNEDGSFKLNKNGEKIPKLRDDFFDKIEQTQTIN